MHIYLASRSIVIFHYYHNNYYFSVLEVSLVGFNLQSLALWPVWYFSDLYKLSQALLSLAEPIATNKHAIFNCTGYKAAACQCHVPKSRQGLLVTCKNVFVISLPTNEGRKQPTNPAFI